MNYALVASARVVPSFFVYFLCLLVMLMSSHSFHDVFAFLLSGRWLWSCAGGDACTCAGIVLFDPPAGPPRQEESTPTLRENASSPQVSHSKVFMTIIRADVAASAFCRDVRWVFHRARNCQFPANWRQFLHQFSSHELACCPFLIDMKQPFTTNLSMTFVCQRARIL